ncbi:hypothetical protein F4818DRAFT_223099 [Hypoxylon cercidicola]|nr:hypothetical protein F4818DRAFT_223099 [Hypoxylon cercidicola]
MSLLQVVQLACMLAAIEALSSTLEAFASPSYKLSPGHTSATSIASGCNLHDRFSSPTRGTTSRHTCRTSTNRTR